MKKYLILYTFFLVLMFSFSTFAEIKKGKWEFIKDIDYCFIQSAPLKTLIPSGKSRSEHYILVYRMNKNPDLIIQITAGFNYKSSDSINVKIDKTEYSFCSDGDTAWAKDDKKVIYAMKKGLDFITTAVSSRGTEVTDIYSLKGFTAAINKLSKDC